MAVLTGGFQKRGYCGMLENSFPKILCGCVTQLFHSHELLLGTVIVLFSHSGTSTHKCIRPWKSTSIWWGWGKTQKLKKGRVLGLWWEQQCLKHCDGNYLNGGAVMSRVETDQPTEQGFHGGRRSWVQQPLVMVGISMVESLEEWCIPSTVAR